MSTPVQSVALNALFLAPGQSGGPETYLRELVTALSDEYPALRMVLFTTGSGAAALRADGFGERVELRALPAEEHSRLRRQTAEQLLLPVAARRARVQLLHSLASTGPAATPGLRSVVTVHDVTFFRIATFDRVTTWGMRQVVSRAARGADALIAVSAASRDEIAATLGIDPQRFAVVHHGIRLPSERDAAPEEEVRRRLDLRDGRVVLCVAAVRPHKNQELLLRALPHLPGDVTVVLAGRQEPYVERLRTVAAELGASDRVRFAGYLPTPQLERLWRLAGCAAFPTRAEGFGMPVLEAMARGVTVACSDLPVLREVGGDVPLYFEPTDPAGAAAAIRAALDDRERGERGRERAGRFSWSEAAHGTMASYRRALGGH
jgi:glycosyltransferase involved in cell wall biosynthesis